MVSEGKEKGREPEREINIYKQVDRHRTHIQREKEQRRRNASQTTRQREEDFLCQTDRHRKERQKKKAKPVSQSETQTYRDQKTKRKLPTEVGEREGHSQIDKQGDTGRQRNRKRRLDKERQRDR